MMFRYKNLSLALFYQALVGLFATILVFTYGRFGFLFIILIAFRPLIFTMVKIENRDMWFYSNYKVLLYSVYSTCAVIILFYIVDILFIPEKFLVANKYKIIFMIIPLGVFMHGVIGYYYFKNYLKDT